MTAAIKRKLIDELRSYWGAHPRYQDIAANIQGKYAFDERPQFGIIVKAGSASKVQFSAQNFMGTVKSYITHAQLPGYPGASVEWVREDSLAIQQNGGRFPSQPGVYYCEMTGETEMYVDPLLEVRDEVLLMASPTEGVLQAPPYPGSLRLYEAVGGSLYREGTDYTVESDGVTVTFLEPVPAQVTVSADYRYGGLMEGPWEVKPFRAYNHIIPGCILAFGDQMQKGDRWVVVVTETREDAYDEYGGKWEHQVDLDIIARDVDSQMDLADKTAMFLMMTLRPQVIDQGIDIVDVSMAGESEEVYDENADDYFFNSAISMTVQTDWAAFVPLVGRIRAIEESLRMLPSDLAPSPFRDPFFSVGFTHEMAL